MVFCVGLTGNLASGKSTVAALFAKLGVEVINADILSKKLTEKGQSAYLSIVTHFGSGILLDDGQIDRRRLRELVFTDPKALHWLEKLLHPLIRKAILAAVGACKTSYCLVEIPLEINKNLYPYINRILLVTAPLEEQIARVQLRDKCSKEQALAILTKQPNLESRLKNADDIIDNTGTIDALEQQVLSLHERYLYK